MRNKIAKKIKKEVYGDQSPKLREYAGVAKRDMYNATKVTVHNKGKRAEYRALKRVYNSLTKKQKEDLWN